MSKDCSPHRRSSSRIDREKATALGVTFAEINETISTNLGSAYINDFPSAGRMQRVIVQADRNARMQPEEILGSTSATRGNQLVPVSSFATVDWRSVQPRSSGTTITRGRAHLRKRQTRPFER